MSGTTTCGPDARARRNWYRVTAVNDDALQSCPCTGGRHPRPQGRARRHRRVERARASLVRHRPAVAPQPATLSQVAGRGGDRGSAGRSARRHRHRAVSAALGRRPSLFHRGRAPHGWTWGGSDAARGRRSGRGRARLPRHPPRSAHDQPRRDLALPQEWLPAIRLSSRLLRGRRRCAAFREAARPQLTRARGRAALFSPDHRIHLRAGLHHDGARTRSGRDCSSGSSSGSSSSGEAGMVAARLKRVALAAAASLLCASAAAQQNLDKVSFGTNWVAEAEHGGHYQALADGTYRRYGLDVTIVPGGPNVNNRLLLPVGKLDFFMSANTLQSFDAVERNIPT